MRGGRQGLHSVAPLLLLPALALATPAAGEGEIAALLQSLPRSRCQFERNGTWHDAPAAVAHLHAKWEYLRRHRPPRTTEEFIDMGASHSSLTGKPYQVRCGGTVHGAGAWLRAELARMRAAPGGTVTPSAR